MKKIISLILSISLITGLLLTSCTDVAKPADGTTDNGSVATSGSAQKSDAPTASAETSSAPEPTSEATSEPTEAPGPSKVTLINSPDSTGNTGYATSHLKLNIAYGQDMVTLMNHMTMFRHGGDISRLPDKVEGFDFQAEDLQYYNGLLYFLAFNSNDGGFYLYKFDGENSPEKVSNSTVYHYEFVNGTIYFVKEFFQGPIFSMKPDGSGETQVTTMRSHIFTHEGQSLYFFATDAGTAPGLVEYNIGTGEETTVIFPFYSHNFLVHGGYVYYSIDGGVFRTIQRVSLADKSVEDIWLEISDYIISFNIADGALYMLVGDSIYKSNLDGSGRAKIFQAEEYLESGFYVFGDRVYCAGESSLYCFKTDGSELNMFYFDELK